MACLGKMAGELALLLSAECDILEHVRHLVDLVGTALDFELLNEAFFVLPRD